MGRKLLKRNLDSIPDRHWREENGTYVLEEHSVDEDWSWFSTKWIYLDGGRKRSFEYNMRIYSEEEIHRLLANEGFTPVKSYGSYRGTDYNDDARHLVIVAEKPV